MKVLDKIRKDNELIKASCNGEGKCGLCKFRSNITLPISKEESLLLTREELENNIRLACKQEYIEGLEYSIINEDYLILDKINVPDIKIKKGQGIALCVDIGTTTIVMKWVDLSNGKIVKGTSFLNPQSSYGADVISRISYDISNPGILHDCLIRKIAEYLDDYPIKKMVVSGNTTMLHLFLNEEVESLGHLPFEIKIKELQVFKSDRIFKDTDFIIYTFPNISAFVGGDIVSGIYGFNLDFKDDKFLFVDLGTNGELVLGNKDGLQATSCAMGPAFEAVGITHGGPSISGAIYHVEIKNKIEYQTIDNKKATSICGSGLISLVSELRRKKLINSKGRLVDKKPFYLTEEIYIDDKDIQNFLLAKASLQVAANQLIKDNNIKKVYLSGGFSNAIRKEDLLTLKILPYDVEIINLSNSSLAGAYRLALEDDIDRVTRIMKMTRSINLAQTQQFDYNYIEALYL